MSCRETLIFAFALLVAPPSLAEQTLDEIASSLEESWSKISSVTAKVEEDWQSNVPGTGIRRMEGQIELLKTSRKTLLRRETRATGGDDMAVSMFDDGDVQHIVTRSEKLGTRVVKGSSHVAVLAPGGSDWLKAMRAVYSLEVMPPDDVDGESCWVLSGSRGDDRTGRRVEKFFLRKKDGLLARVEHDGVIAGTTRYSDFKLNVAINVSRFTVEIPEDARVLNTTTRPSTSQPLVDKKAP